MFSHPEEVKPPAKRKSLISKIKYPMFLKLETLCVMMINLAPLDIKMTVKLNDYSLVQEFYIVN